MRLRRGLVIVSGLATAMLACGGSESARTLASPEPTAAADASHKQPGFPQPEPSPVATFGPKHADVVTPDGDADASDAVAIVAPPDASAPPASHGVEFYCASVAERGVRSSLCDSGPARCNEMRDYMSDRGYAVGACTRRREAFCYAYYDAGEDGDDDRRVVSCFAEMAQCNTDRNSTRRRNRDSDRYSDFASCARVASVSPQASGGDAGRDI